MGMGFNTWLQGRACRMNPVSVFLAVLLFGWLWGGWGLLLGAPIAAVVKTIADRVEGLKPFGELLGQVPTKPDPARPGPEPAEERSPRREPERARDRAMGSYDRVDAALGAARGLRSGCIGRRSQAH